MATRKPISIILGFALTVCVSAWATDDPHGSANTITCQQCHIQHGSLGDILADSPDSLLSTLCLSCHSPGGWIGMAKELSSSQKATPGLAGTSHAWDVKADNTAYGALLPQTPVIFEHLTPDSSITCATCHDPHSNSISPFLRLDNSADALCLDCHRSRNVSTVRTHTGLAQSHPVGVSIPADATYHNPPLDVDGNPQPSDGNSTNDLPLVGGVVRCTSCHGVHFTDSNSGTVDGP